ncbi:MAG: polyprenyl synthetase family protein [Aestuariivirga sp.]
MILSSPRVDASDHSEFRAIRLSIEEQLRQLITAPAAAPSNLRDAMGHALLAPSKRVRPMMLYLVAEPSNGLASAALDAGSAVEMIHTASLILDDLPCMDDAELRRQRPTTHVAFGEATAILSAIALLAQAFNILAELEGVSAETRTRLSQILSNAVGWNGLAAGQELDINGAGNGNGGFHGQNEIERVNWLKTGALFEAAVEMGAVLGNRSEAQIEAVRKFAKHFGLAYQALDDLRDSTSSVAELGKDVNKDKDKVTSVTRFGLRRAQQECKHHLGLADDALVESGVAAAPLRALVSQLFSVRVPVI